MKFIERHLVYHQKILHSTDSHSLNNSLVE